MRFDDTALFSWPLALHVITAGWTYTNGNAHGGLDFRAIPGTPVFACEGGTVDWVQRWNGYSKAGNQSYGNIIRIRHKDYRGRPLYTLYAHLSAINVKIGQQVTESQQIGLSGETGNCYGAHLHFEVQYGGTGSARRVHPLNWLDNDYTCSTTAVKAHLGRFTSVQRPVITGNAYTGERTVTASALNLRAAASTSAKVVAVLPKGTVVYATGADQGGWLPIVVTLGGEVYNGWVSTKYLS